MGKYHSDSNAWNAELLDLVWLTLSGVFETLTIEPYKEYGMRVLVKYNGRSFAFSTDTALVPGEISTWMERVKLFGGEFVPKYRAKPEESGGGPNETPT